MKVEDVDYDSDFDGSTFSDDDINNPKEEATHSHSILALLFVCTFGIMFESSDNNNHKRTNIKKTKEEREAPWEFVETWAPSMFKRQFRMDRLSFFDLLEKIISIFPGTFGSGKENYCYSCRQGNNAHGHHIPLQIKLCVTLRLLAGASYLDMIWYGVSMGHVETVFVDTLHLIDAALPDSEWFDCHETTDFDKMAHEWSSVMINAKGTDLMPGTILAGDGLVVQIQAPCESDRDGGDLAGYRNRKGYFALIVQAFCDAFCMFRYFEISWPGATPDLVAYKQTALYHMFTSQPPKIPVRFHMVLDEAYSSIGGNQHLCPFSKHQLRTERSRDPQLYSKMKAFNNSLSSQRITIERAFGMLVRKWGIFWRPIAYGLVTIALIVKVCAKLHNFCIMRWKKIGTRADDIARMEEDYVSYRDAEIFRAGQPQNVADEEDVEGDGVVREMMINAQLPDPNPNAAGCSERKQYLMDHIYNSGFFYDVVTDDLISRR